MEPTPSAASAGRASTPEPQRIRAIDTHQHFWEGGKEGQTWRKPGHEILAGDFVPADLAQQMQATGIGGTVAIQSVNTAEETDYLLGVADAHPFVLGVVGWAPLERPADAAALLDRHAGRPKLKGVRHLINTEPDPDWLIRPAVLDGLALLAERGLTFDIVAISERHMQHVPTVAEEVPGLRIVLDHLARPPVLDNGWEPWASLLARSAEYPQVSVKISAGIDVVTDWAAWSGDELRPYIDWALQCFGPDRAMFASNWPVVLLAGSYEHVWRETNRAIAERSEQERDAVLRDTAARFYDLDLPAADLT